MNPTKVYQWIAEVTAHFPMLGKWQAMGLALLSMGIALAEHSSLSRVAEGMAYQGQVESLTKRFKRWVSNRDIDVLLCCESWIGWVWEQYDASRPLLLVDETKLGDRFGVMMVSLAFEQRAIPLVWRCYRANSAADYPQQGQVMLVWQLLARVLSALPPDCRPLVQMDRGIAQSAAMLRALDNLGVFYLVRLKGYTRFTSRRGKPQLLRDLVKPGEYVTCRGWVFKTEKHIGTTVHLLWEPGQREPWCLATNDPSLRGSLYARRMWQEESFRDLKSGGWQWQCSRLNCPHRMERLILALALAYAWMLTLGTLVLHAPTSSLPPQEVRQRYSVFRLGLRYFKQACSRSDQPLVVGLFFAPRPYRLCT